MTSGWCYFRENKDAAHLRHFKKFVLVASAGYLVISITVMCVLVISITVMCVLTVSMCVSTHITVIDITTDYQDLFD